MGSGENGQADDVGVFLQRRGDDLLRCLPEAGVDNLHACVAQCTRDHLRPTVVAVESRLGDDYSDFIQLPAPSFQFPVSSFQLDDGLFLIFPPDLAKRVAHLSHCGVCAHGVEQRRHRVLLPRRGFFQLSQRPVDNDLAARPSNSVHLLELPSGDVFIDMEGRHRVVRIAHELIDADDDASVLLDFPLLSSGGFGDLALEPARLD